MSPLVSVIVPIYNTATYLEQCLDSIVSQSYSYLEIILVNDGSTDRSAEIAQSYADRDKRICYIEQENRGVGAARNTGLEKAKGELVYFIDSDDYIDVGYIFELVQAMHGYDIALNTKVCFCYKERVEMPLYKLYAQGQFMLSPHSIQYFEYYVWNALFKRETIDQHNICFSERGNAEDSEFLYCYLSFAPRAHFVNTYAYHYRQREDSAIGKIKQSHEFPLEPLESFACIYRWYERHGVLSAYGLPFKLLYEFGHEYTNKEQFFTKARQLVRELGITKRLIQYDRRMDLFMRVGSASEFLQKKGFVESSLLRRFRIRLSGRYRVVKLFGIVLYEHV